MHHLQQKNNIKQAILSAIIYSDIFDYPLTKKEISQYIVNTSKEYSLVLQSLVQGKIIVYKTGYFCLSGREKIIALRKVRKNISEKKIGKAKKIVKILQNIPTVELVGLSGSLAMKNAELHDDIDLFIITKKNTLWITRLCVLMMLQILGLRRKRFAIHATDVICVNMFMDEKNLLLPKEKQNIYTAHEVLSMKPIFIRNNAHQRFIQENFWFTTFIPNAKLATVNKKSDTIFSYVAAKILFLLEVPSKKMQQLYMKNHTTTEIITTSMLAFHPHDPQNRILHEYKKKIRQIR